MPDNFDNIVGYEEDDPEMSKEKAKEVFAEYMKGHGVTEVLLLDMSDRCHAGQWEIQCLKPYGIFFVNKLTGEIEDNYGVFEKEGDDSVNLCEDGI